MSDTTGQRFEGTSNYIATDDLKVAVDAELLVDLPVLGGGIDGNNENGESTIDGYSSFTAIKTIDDTEVIHMTRDYQIQEKKASGARHTIRLKLIHQESLATLGSNLDLCPF